MPEAVLRLGVAKDKQQRPGLQRFHLGALRHRHVRHCGRTA
jgi:hypothetical protein